MAEVSRNDPCPCGSGLKHKKCCLGKAPPMRGKRLLWYVLLFCVIIGAAAAVGVFHGIKSGLGVGAGLLLAAGIIIIARGAPPSRGSRSGPSDINFGR